MISLLDSINDTSYTMASILPHIMNSIKTQEANQNQTTNILGEMAKNQESVQNQTTKLLSQLADTQIIMANTQAEMAKTLNHVVLILQGNNMFKYLKIFRNVKQTALTDIH